MKIEVMYENLRTQAVETLELPASETKISDFFNKLNPGGHYDTVIVHIEAPGMPEKFDYGLLYQMNIESLNVLAEKWAA